MDRVRHLGVRDERGTSRTACPKYHRSGSMADTKLIRDFGPLIRSIRKQQGRSQEDVAWRARIDQSDLSKYERGIITPRPEVVERIATALGIDMETLFVGD